MTTALALALAAAFAARAPFCADSHRRAECRAGACQGNCEAFPLSFRRSISP